MNQKKSKVFTLFKKLVGEVGFEPTQVTLQIYSLLALSTSILTKKNANPKG
jgi:hypothetical protein